MDVRLEMAKIKERHSSKSSQASHSSSIKKSKQKKSSSLLSKNRNVLKNVVKKPKKFSCTDCKYSAGSSWSLRCHKMSNHIMIITILLCPTCSHSSGTKELLKKHIQYQIFYTNTDTYVLS